MEDTIKVHYWHHHESNADFVFPEQDPEGPIHADLENKQNLGLCFSGGGTRAASAAVGQLRALHHLNLLDDVRYISAVSGGAWTMVPYTFLPTDPNNDGLSQFLGCYVGPENLTGDDLQTQRGSMLRAVSNAWVTGRAPKKLLGFRGSESYSRVLSKVFLEEFGLADNHKWFTWSEDTAASVIMENQGSPLFSSPEYYTVAPGRPYLIVGGTIRHYDRWPWKWENDPIKRVPIEFTPLYSGVRPWIKPGNYNPIPLGGGYVESFAYDSVMAVKDKDNDGLARVNVYRKRPWRTEPLLNLGDLIGTSGAAPGEFSVAVELLGFPKFNHWSPRTLAEESSANSARFAHQDGGLSENLGLLPLLARRVERIIAFVNAEDEVIVGNGPASVPDYINGLFGRAPSGMYDATQVFPSEELDAIATQLATNIRSGRATVATSAIRTIENSRFGVGKYDVEILWIFLDARLSGEERTVSRTWLSKMPEDSGVRERIETDRRFKRFPRYKTFLEDRPFLLWDVIRLSEDKASALAHYTSWVVVSEEEAFRSFFTRRDQGSDDSSSASSFTPRPSQSSMP